MQTSEVCGSAHILKTVDTFTNHLCLEQAKHQTPFLLEPPKILTEFGASEAKRESSEGETSAIQSIK